MPGQPEGEATQTMGFGGVKMKTKKSKLVAGVAKVGEKDELETGPSAESITGMKDGGLTACETRTSEPPPCDTLAPALGGVRTVKSEAPSDP